MAALPAKTLAIDWSGAKSGFEKKIWLAEATTEGLVELRDGWSREGITGYLASRAKERDLVVGLDFCFSFPAWFVRDAGRSTIDGFWRHVAERGESWLDTKNVPEPFFRKGRWERRRSQFRHAEERLAAQGTPPETIFKLVGAKQVGPGSIRGMPCLLALRKAGFNIWPFDPPELPMVVEIYPRLFYGSVKKSSGEQRADFLSGLEGLDDEQRHRAGSSDDAFDAAVSALAMFERRQELATLPQPADATLPAETALEGWIFGAPHDP